MVRGARRAARLARRRRLAGRPVGLGPDLPPPPVASNTMPMLHEAVWVQLDRLFDSGVIEWTEIDRGVAMQALPAVAGPPTTCLWREWGGGGAADYRHR